MRRKGALRRNAVGDLGPIQQSIVRNTAHLASRLLAEPFDAIRLTQFVGSPLAGSNMWETAKNIYNVGGQRFGYRAIASSLLDYFGFQKRTAWRYTVLTTISQLIFAVTTHPIEIIRVRMRHVALTPFAYAGAFSCLIDLLEHDGIGSLFHGLSIAPFGAIWSSFGRLVANEILSWSAEKRFYSPSAISFCLESVFSGLSGTLISQPFYLVQKKMMVSYEYSRGRLPSETMLKGVTPQSSWTTTALAVYDQHGLSGFWSGAFSNSIRHATINIIEDSLAIGLAYIFSKYNEMKRRTEEPDVDLTNEGAEDDEDYDDDDSEHDEAEDDQEQDHNANGENGNTPDSPSNTAQSPAAS